MNMLNPFVCGTFHPEHDEPCLASPGSSPKKSKRKDNRNNNPYSSRGLDKFSELLADLNEKRQKIYSQMNPHDISIVRFVHSNTDDFVPIVVKVKNNKDQKHKSQEIVKAKNLTPISESTDKYPPIESTATMEEKGKQPNLESDNRKLAKKSLSWNMKKWDTGKPSFYMPVGNSSNTRRSSMKKKDYVRVLSEKKMVVVTNEGGKKKDYVRGMSEKKMVVNEGVKKKDYVRGWSEKKMATDGLLSPRSGDSEDSSKNKTPGKHSHKKSW
ncbi:hypothetical protein SESBI_41512 [Sesbania bispinosa]|nr:hypothetical protein SESBI_41512 [Sesbania bispinosa]